MSAGFTEQELIETLLRGYRSAKPILGPGDDAGILAVPDGRLVTTVDTITEDQDFRRVWPCGYRTTGYDVGWKSVAQNLSDINAMGARPTGIVTSLSLPADVGLDWVESFAAGVTNSIDQLGAHDCAIVGGDVGRGREISVTTTAFGSLDGGAPVLRSGAQLGDVLAVCGNLGFAAAGLALLEQAPESGPADPLPIGEFPAHWDDAMRDVALHQLRPRPPIGAGVEARLAGAHAMLDISDGLLRDTERVAAASEQGIALDSSLVSRLAAPGAIAGGGDASNLARWIYTGGEDFALIATFGPGQVPSGRWHPLGTTTMAGTSVHVDGRPTGLYLKSLTGQSAAGWDPFACAPRD